MANRDVKMVISAQDKASQATNAVKEALLALREAQLGASDSSNKTGNSLQAFGSALGTLQQALRGDDIGARLEQQFNKASSAIKRLETAIEETSKNEVEYARRSRETGRAVDNERKSVIALEATLSKEKATRQALRSELDKANRVVARAETAGTAVTPAQIQAVRQADAAFQKQAATVQELDSRLKTARASVTALIREERRLARQADNAGEALVTQNGKLGEARAELVKLTKEAGMAERALEELGRSASRELSRAVSTQSTLTSNAGVEARGAQSGVGPAEQQFLAAQRAADEYQVSLGASAQKTRELRAESDRLEQSFNDQKGLADALTQEYAEQQRTLSRLAAISQEAAGDVNEIAARQARFTAEQQRGQRAVEQIRASIDRYQSSITRASERTQRMAAEQARLAAATVRTSGGTRTLTQALRSYFGEGKRALSITQRLRGQVLSLATQYVGFFAVFQGIGAVVGSVQQLEGATNSLSAVFDGDFTRTNQELDFLRRNADRLGIGFGQLSDDYSKFAAATKNTPIQDETRDIFISVAEAGRVLNLTSDQLSGTLTALSQIASKGVVSMEELRQQLGDRLPGALQIMADGLGKTTGELIKLIEKGELSSTALVGFADELDKRFGPQLAGSLTSLNAELGRFTNALFESQIAFANGGFLESFISLIQTATETLKSADFQSFLGSVGQGFGVAFGIAEVAIKNFQLVFTALTGFIAAKFAPIVIGTTVSIFNYTQSTKKAVAGTALMARGLLTGATSFRTLGASASAASLKIATGARTAKAALVSSGIGIAFIAISTALAALSTQADETEMALSSQQGVLDELQNAFETGTAKAEDYEAALNKITAAEAQRNLQALQEELRLTEAGLNRILSTASNSTDTGFKGFLGALKQVGGNVLAGQFDDLTDKKSRISIGLQNDLTNLGEQLLARTIDVTKFNESLDKLTSGAGLNPQQTERVALFAEETRDAAKVAEAAAKAKEVLRLKGEQLAGTLTTASVETGNLVDEVKDLGNSSNNSGGDLVSLEETIRKISKGVPELADEIKKIEDLEKLGETLEAAGLSADLEVLTRRARELQTLADQTEGVPGVGRLAAQRAAEFNQLLEVTQKRIEAINNPKQSSSGRDPFEEARKRIEEAISGDELQLQVDALRSQGRELEAIARERAIAFEKIVEGLEDGQKQKLVEEFGMTFEELGNQIFEATRAEDAKQGLQEITDAVEEAQIALDEATRGDDTATGRQGNFAASLARDIADMQREVDSLDLTPLEAAEAQKGIDRIMALRTSVFNLEEGERQLDDARAEAQTALSALNDLEERRRTLVEQANLALKQGNDVNLANLQSRINGVDGQIEMAKNNARGLLMNVVALGGDEALTALERLDAQVENTQEVVAGTQVSFKQLGDIITNNLGTGLSNFLENIAGGENVLKSFVGAVQQFASQTLIEIGRVIAQALIMRAVLGAFGLGGIGGGGTLLAGIPASIAHDGKTGGTGTNRSRTVPASTFAGAPKFHEGRTGLSTGEMAAIIKTDEDVLTRDNPFHSSNLTKTVGGLRGSGGGGGDVKVVNVLDPADMLEAALSDTPGQRVLLNHIRRSSRDINTALEG